METTTFEDPPLSVVMVLSTVEIRRSTVAEVMETNTDTNDENCIFDWQIITELS